MEWPIQVQSVEEHIIYVQGSESISRMIQIAHQFNVDNETQKVQVKDTILR
jgi:hypothetical protein